MKMKRIIKLSEKYYGYDLSYLEDNPEELLNDLNVWLNQGEPVILVNVYEDAENFDIPINEIMIVEKD